MSVSQPTAIERLAPRQLDAATRLRIQGLIELMGRFRRRLWWQKAGQRLLRVASAVLPIAALLIIALRLALVGRQHDSALLFVCLGVAGLLLAWALVHRLPWHEAARRVDMLGQGRDRAATAVEMAAQGRADAWAQVQADAANRWAAGLDVSEMLPQRRPAGLGLALVSGLAVWLAVAAPMDWLSADGGAPDRSGLALVLPVPPSGFAAVAAEAEPDPLERDLLVADLALLAEIRGQLEQGPTERWLADVQKTISEVERGALGHSDALARLAELDKQRPKDPLAAPQESAGANGPKDGADKETDAANDGSAGDSPGAKMAGQEQARAADKAVRDVVAESLKKSLEAAPSGAVRDALKAAAEQKDLGAISKLIEKIAERDMSDKELEKWIKVAEKFAAKLGDQKIPKRFEKIAKRIQRLQNKRKQQGGLNAGDRRRLRDTKRQLQQLRREHGDVAAARYRLQRLERGARQAANEMRRNQSSRMARGAGPKPGESAADLARRRREAGRKFRERMRQAAGELRRESRRQKEGHAQRIGQSRIRDLRQALSRSQRGSRMRSESQRAGSQGAQAKAGAGQDKQQGQNGTKKPGKPGDRMRAAREGGRKAGEQAAREKAKAGQGRNGKGHGQGQGKGQGRGRSGVRLGQGDMKGQTRMRTMQAAAEAGGGSQGVGQQAGNETGGTNDGKRPGIRAGRTEKIQGIHGKGPTTKQTFLDAARRGFARRNWRHVYARYTAVAQEMMDSEALPAGRRALVQRYFELIRPRVSGASPSAVE